MTAAEILARRPVVDKCDGCGHTEEVDGGTFCKVYRHPDYKWSVGACNMATHAKSEVVQQAKMLNPLKASKKAARGRH